MYSLWPKRVRTGEAGETELSACSRLIAAEANLEARKCFWLDEPFSLQLVKAVCSSNDAFNVLYSQTMLNEKLRGTFHTRGQSMIPTITVLDRCVVRDCQSAFDNLTFMSPVAQRGLILIFFQ